MTTIISKSGEYEGTFLEQPTDWMVGDATGMEREPSEFQLLVGAAVLGSIMPVKESDRSYTSCSEGVVRTGTADGERDLPVRLRAVGGSAMLGFVAAEAVGASFYQDDNDAPVYTRVERAMALLRHGGMKPSAHDYCHINTTFLETSRNEWYFRGYSSFIHRLEAIMPHYAYSPVMHNLAVINRQNRLQAEYCGMDDYKVNYDDHTFTQAVIHAAENPADLKAIERSPVVADKDALIVYLDDTIDDAALHGPSLEMASRHGELGKRVMASSYNGSVINRIANLFAEADGAEPSAYSLARHAMESFSASAHGNNNSLMPTLLVRRRV